MQRKRAAMRAVGILLALFTSAGALVGASSPSGASTEAIATFSASADTYVSATNPTTSYGRSGSLRVDTSPAETTYLRFDVAGLAGRQITSAVLRLTQRNSSPSGGDVFAVSSVTWPESMTYSDRAAIDGPMLGSFPAVTPGVAYEVDVTAAVVGGGMVAFAVVATNSDSSTWNSREAKTGRPQLTVTYAAGDEVLDGVSTVAESRTGSSDPTYFPTNHRLALTGAGRLLTVHGIHGTGVQLAWRDPAGLWQTRSRGPRADGVLLADTKTGDWPASIVVVTDSAGVEVAWVVWAGASFSSPKPLQVRRLTDLDSPDGPVIGPLVTLDAPALGAARADIQVQTDLSGEQGLAVLYYRRAADSSYEAVAGWLDSPDSETPALSSPTVLYATTSSSRSGTLVAGADGSMRVVGRSASGRLVQWRHAPDAPLTSWTLGSNGPAVAGYPAAAALADGDVVAVVEADTTNHVVTVQRIGADGVVRPVEHTATGYAEPTLTTDGHDVWIVMLRVSDGALVSRRTSGGTWGGDVVELGPEVGAAGYPNAVRQADGRLRLVVQGPTGATNRTAVLAYQRVL